MPCPGRHGKANEADWLELQSPSYRRRHGAAQFAPRPCRPVGGIRSRHHRRCPRGNDLARSAILASDHVLIPVQPAPFDIWAARQTVELIEAAQEFKPEIAASFVISRSITNTAIARDAAKAFAGQAFPVAPGAITQRVVFPEFRIGWFDGAGSRSERSEYARTARPCALCHHHQRQESRMSKKSVSLSMQKPAPSARAENWVAKSDGSERTKRVTFEIPLSCMPESNPNVP